VWRSLGNNIKEVPVKKFGRKWLHYSSTGGFASQTRTYYLLKGWLESEESHWMGPVSGALAQVSVSDLNSDGKYISWYVSLADGVTAVDLQEAATFRGSPMPELLEAMQSCSPLIPGEEAEVIRRELLGEGC
jgi:hypothetical protein